MGRLTQVSQAAIYNLSRPSSRFPAPTLPKVSQWEDMLSTAFSLAVVGYVINIAMGRTLAAKHGYNVDPNQVEKHHSLVPTCTSLHFDNVFLHVLGQEMLALGCSNFLGSFFKIHVICCALSVTLAVDNAGGTSQVSTVVTMMVLHCNHLLNPCMLLLPFLRWPVCA